MCCSFMSVSPSCTGLLMKGIILNACIARACQGQCGVWENVSSSSLLAGRDRGSTAVTERFHGSDSNVSSGPSQKLGSVHIDRSMTIFV